MGEGKAMNNYHTGTPSLLYEKVTELFSGTGGSPINLWFATGTLGQLVVEKPYKAESPSYIEAIQDEITNVFGISMTDLADACRVARATPYNWRKEKSINRRTKGMDRLFLLSQAAENWIDSGNTPMGSNYETKFFGNTSLKDLLTADVINLDKIQFLGTRYKLNRLG
jgi:hypothetical protein